DGDVQALLQVTYEDYRIVEVIDVSGRDAAYFERELDDAWIRGMVEGLQARRGPDMMPALR
ncbi:MAG: hypothetical protein QME94_18515, partial [Anaerolineae bacterium]|nr:hypothetical protein [Anaerolineae bacterium]